MQMMRVVENCDHEVEAYFTPRLLSKTHTNL